MTIGPFELDSIVCGDAYKLIKQIPDKAVDLIYTDVPYLYQQGGSGSSELGERTAKKRLELMGMTDVYEKHKCSTRGEALRIAKNIKKTSLDVTSIEDGINYEILDEFVRVMKKINCFIWCSKLQILDIMKFFVEKHNCYFEILTWCLSGDTNLYIKGQRGITISTIKDLARMDYKKVELWNGEKWTKITNIMENKDPHNIKQIELRSGEKITCTGRHSFPTQRGIIPAFDLQIGDIIQSCQLPDSICNTSTFLTTDILWLIGLFLAEGSYSDDCMQLSLNKDEFSWFERIQKTAQYLGGNATYTIKNNSLSIRMSGKVLYAILHEYLNGNTAKGKHLSTSVWKLDNNSLKPIVEGYLDGDAQFDKPNNRYRLGFTRNTLLARDLRTLASRLNATLTLKEYISTNTKTNKKHESYKGEWRWSKSDRTNNRQEIVAIRDRKKGQAKFWDIEVEDEPHLFALASGVLTHNCKTNPTPSTNNSWLPDIEYCLYFREKGVPLNDGYEYKSKFYVAPANVSDKKKFEHMTIKPLPFVEKHILHASKEGDIVFDPFAGSGTTLVSAKNNKRHYLGFEIVEKWQKIASDRLNDIDATGQYSMFTV